MTTKLISIRLDQNLYSAVMKSNNGSLSVLVRMLLREYVATNSKTQ